LTLTSALACVERCSRATASARHSALQALPRAGRSGAPQGTAKYKSETEQCDRHHLGELMSVKNILSMLLYIVCLWWPRICKTHDIFHNKDVDSKVDFSKQIVGLHHKNTLFPGLMLTTQANHYMRPKLMGFLLFTIGADVMEFHLKLPTARMLWSECERIMIQSIHRETCSSYTRSLAGFT